MTKIFKLSKILTIVMIVALVSISACIKQPAPKPIISETPTATGTTKMSEVTVDIKGSAFNPSVITISRGTKVTWTQSDSTAHTVTSIESNILNSQALSKGQTYSYTFNRSGTFEYGCSIHPSMKGRVTVYG